MPDNLRLSNTKPLKLIIDNTRRLDCATPQPTTDDVVAGSSMYHPKDSAKITRRIRMLLEQRYPVQRANAYWIKVGKFRLHLKKGTIVEGENNICRFKGFSEFYHIIAAYRQGTDLAAAMPTIFQFNGDCHCPPLPGSPP